MSTAQFAVLAAFAPIARMDYRSLQDWNPTAKEMKAGAVARFPDADGFVFSHIAVTPTPGWGDITAVRMTPSAFTLRTTSV